MSDIHVTKWQLHDKVIFNHPEDGHNSDQEQCAKYLKVGKTYTLQRIRIGGFHSNVRLKEIPSVTFNSVMFDLEEK